MSLRNVQSHGPIDPTPDLCLACRGSRMLCGRVFCPIIVKNIVKKKLNISNQIYGSSPPSIFVGRIGYPRVYVGPMTPPYTGDTTILDLPEDWVHKKIEEIVDYRFSLIRGKIAVNVKNASNPSKYLEIIQEFAMGEKPVDAEMILEKKPAGSLTFNEETPPYGPSAPLKAIRLGGNIYVDARIEKAYYDKYLKAEEAVIQLYSKKVPVSRIQRVFSAGVLGEKSERKFVPTRWSITAVDDIISRNIINEIKNYPIINEYLVYVRKHLDNLFIGLFIPDYWSYEWIEAWFPQTTWNLTYNTTELIGDHEGYKGRTIYAKEIGGCYYAARLAAAEALKSMKRQATVLLLREIYPGFTLPLGVWFVRENLREMFKQKPMKFNTLNEALQFVASKSSIKLERWLRVSWILNRILFQTKLTKFIGDETL
ncbi:MAG: Nre family DNA repair protein [Thermoprotei archaeon]